MKNLMKIYYSGILVLLLGVCTLLSAQAGEVTSTFSPGGTLTATQMNEIKDAVNDNNANIGANTTAIGDNAADIGTNNTNIGINDSAITGHESRITDLEGASPAIGRLALSVSDGNPNKTLDDATTSSAVSTVFPSPSDYAAGGTVTIKALVSGCSGQNVLVSIARNGVNVGSNSSLIIINPSAQTIAIPAGTIFTFFVVEVEMTTTVLSDLNTVTLSRSGADAADTCASGLFVRGFIVEYPRG